MKRSAACWLAIALMLFCLACTAAPADAPAARDGGGSGAEQTADAAGSADVEQADARHGFTQEGATARIFDTDYGSYQVRSMVCLDKDGYVLSVKERYTFPETKDGEQSFQQLAIPEVGSYTAEGNLVYFTWSDSTVEEQFGSLYQDEIQRALDTWERGDDETKPEIVRTAVNAQILKKNGLLLTVTNIRYAMGSLIEFDLKAENTGNSAKGYYLLETYLNGWLVDTDFSNIVLLQPDETDSRTVSVRGMDTGAFASMDIEAVQTLQFCVRLFREGGQAAGDFPSAVVHNPECPAEYVQAYDDSGMVLLDDDSAKVVQRRFDSKSRRAQIYLEKKDTSKWTNVAVTPVFNGFSALYNHGYYLQKGVRALIDLDGTAVCEQYGFDALSQIDVYLTYYHKDKLKDPVHLTLVNPRGGGQPAARPPIAYPAVFEGEYCIIRYVGWSTTYYSDADVLLLECENISDKYLSVYQMYDYMLLDGQRVPAAMSNANVFPHSVTTMALFADDSAYADLSGFTTAETSLGVYEIRSGYHNLLESAGKVSLDIRP